METLTKTPGRAHIVEHRRVALNEERHARQIRKGLFTNVRGENFAVPVDSKDAPTRFLHREMWQATPHYAPCQDHPMARWVSGRCTAQQPPVMRAFEAALLATVPEREEDVFTAIGDAALAYGDPFKACQNEPVFLTMSVHRPGVVFAPAHNPIPGKVLATLNEVDRDISYRYYMEVLGHDLHMSAFASLYAYHWHAGWLNPFTLEMDEPLDHTFETDPKHPGHVARKTKACQRHMAFSRDCAHCGVLSEPIDEWRLRAMMINVGTYGGFAENLGLLNQALMTTAFDSEIVDELNAAAASEFADFDFHEVGTSSAAEANTQTALTTTSGIARATGTPADEDPDYANDGTITADATETWEEHGLFNNSTGAAMMDRNLTGGQAVNSSDQITYQGTWTFNPEV